jgi:outer membrane protein
MTKITFTCIIFICCILLCIQKTDAQTPYRLTLDEVVELAQSDAPDALLAQTRWKYSYWTYQSFLADFKPQIVLNATLPSFNRSITPIVLPSGQYIFQQVSNMQNSVDLGIQQDIAATGGRVTLGSGLSRLDQFATTALPRNISYLSTPIDMRIDQPLFQFNAMKWRKKIQPVEYEESQKVYSEEMESVAQQAASYFFDLLISQLDAQAAEQDKLNADTLLVLSRGRFEVGKIAETDLLQVELSAMQAETRLAESQLRMQTNAEQLRDFLNLQGDVTFDLIPPYTLPVSSINPEDALTYARQNRSTVVAFQRRLLAAQASVAQAKGETGVSAYAQGRFGLTQDGPTISRAYNDPIDNEVFSLGITAPIADWGKSKARKSVALAGLELEQRQVDQERENFDRVVLLRAQQFELIRRNTEVASRYFEASKKRYDITYQRYLIGKIDVTELNLALGDQESARIAYLQAIRDFWMAVYEVRGLTLYDFVNNKSLMLQAPTGN